MKNIKRIAILSIAALVTIGITGCKKSNKNDDKKYYDNEADPLVFSIAEVDKVFNPFFSTSATDGEVAGLTQIGMLGNDKDGKVVYGDKEAVVVKDLEIKTTGTAGVNQKTTYYFVLKNNVRFSNGSYMTIKDVLFNLYVYLDPAYTGSSTIYSTDIVGLKEYRTQAATENEQDAFMDRFQIQASARIDALVEASDFIVDEHKSEDLTTDKFKEYLEEYATDFGSTYSNIVTDFEKALVFFKEEIESDYTNSMDSYESTIFTDEMKNAYRNLFTTDVEQFLYNEGYITWSKKDAELTCEFMDFKDVKNLTKEQAIKIVYDAKVPNSISEIVQYWAAATKLYDFLVNQGMEDYFSGNTSRLFPNISGIKFANKDEEVTVNNVKYAKASYDEAGNVKPESNEVLSITINDVDPKAIWNFSFAVAPMYYYSDKAHVDAFDYESNFGVEYASQSFMNDVVNAPSKVGVPVGAGAYAASKSSGGITNIDGADFYNLGVIYYERNPYYVMGTPKIKKVRYQVVAANQMLQNLYDGYIDFAQPNAKPETITELDSKASSGIANKAIRTSGYGYIGINAGKVPDYQVRQAIMHCINTLECVAYYKTTATAIYRPMSMSSWAYPKGCTAYYPYVGAEIPADLGAVSTTYAVYVRDKGYKAGQVMSKADQIEFITSLVEEAGYELNGSAIYQKGSNVLKYTFTIAGEETDHPAWNAMWHAKELLDECGFQVTVTTDANALKKLSTGDLTVWAAAWGSTIDPDMYQVYHKDSKATSVLNWGYKQILMNNGGKYEYENTIVKELSELIDSARKTNDTEIRTSMYSKALDLVMQLAVELPTYQRNDLYAYNANKIDVNTLTKESELSPFKGLVSDLYSVSLVNKEK